MKIRDLTEVAVWTVITLIVVMGVFGSHIAQSQGPEVKPVEPSVMVDDVKITVSVKPASEPYKVLLDVTAVNTSSKQRKIDPAFVITRNEFTGSPLSRTISPDDQKKTVEDTVKLKLTVPPSKTVKRTLTVPIQARPVAQKKSDPGKPVVSGFPPTYTVTLEGQKEPVPLANFSANVAWPKK